MGTKDPRIDAYISRSAEFARPILKHLRNLVHEGCPAATETLKWSMPWFEYKGLLCGMAAFKHHATFGFWNHKLIVGDTGEKDGMGQFGRITSLSDLPPDKILLKHIRRAVELKDTGVKQPLRTRTKARTNGKLTVPEYFATALQSNPRARQHFENFSYSHQKEYLQWVTSAKREETRQRRLDTAVAWLAQGKPQNWKYMRS